MDQIRKQTAALGSVNQVFNIRSKIRSGKNFESFAMTCTEDAPTTIRVLGRGRSRAANTL